MSKIEEVRADMVKALMPKVKGKADGKLVNEILTSIMQ